MDIIPWRILCCLNANLLSHYCNGNKELAFNLEKSFAII